MMIKKILNFSRKWIQKPGAIFSRSFEANFYFSNIHVPLVVLVFYFVSFAIVHSYILSIPIGVNYVFASISWKYIALLAAGSSLFYFVIVRFKKGGKLEIKNTAEQLSKGDFLLLLFPLTPVVQYILNNQDILSPLASLFVFAIFIVFSALYIFVVPAILGFVGSIRTWTALGLAFVYTILNMASLSHSYAWFERGDLKIQWMVLCGVFLGTWLLFGLSRRKFLRLLILIVFVSNSAMQLMNKYNRVGETSLPVEENKLLQHIEGRKPHVSPSIYLLVYDAYVSNETMLAYGIDNSEQEETLKELDFMLYPHTYTIGNLSLQTMSRVLNASIDIYDNDERNVVSGNGVVQNILSGFGYQTYGLFPSDYFFIEHDPSYDFSIPGRPSSPGILARAIILGEFRFDVGFNKLPREQFVETKQRILQGVSGGPVFVYTHSNLPGHSQNSGVCRPEEVELFEEKLTRANSEMREDIDLIIKNDPGAIVVIAGDHGPYLTKNCNSIERGYDASEISRLDIQDRYGTFLAIRWPNEDFAKYDNITVLQDLFPAVFAYLFKDERILEAKVDPSTFSNIVSVQNGTIHGGIHDSEPLFLANK